ncbi:MAG: putative zinc-binding metallopeptidase [Bacteriovoracaceae bacterium]|jgi:hypothetical protein|nr:putative zinc-binding metallopeptidase [Bacteriovoracaceae bacterium]
MLDFFTYEPKIISMRIEKLNKLSKSEILELPICEIDFKFRAEQKVILRQISSKLKNLGLKWTPHTWFSQEWFSPDSVSGFAIPFVLTSAKLIALEKEYLGFCEGDTPTSFTKLCCHEIGHAIDNAYKLRLSKKRQQLFGKTSYPYPNSYHPNPHSKDYIHFLGDFYAQAHPDEDWAETFGHFLYYGNLPKKYLNTVVEKKYKLVQEILLKRYNTTNFKENFSTPLNTSDDTRTIKEYLIEKKHSLKLNKKNYFKNKVTFLSSQKNQKLFLAYPFLKQKKKSLIRKISQRTSTNPWEVSQQYNELLALTKKESLYMAKYQTSQIESVLKTHLADYIKKGQTRVYM